MVKQRISGQDKPSKLSHKGRHARWILKFTKAKRQQDRMIPSTDLAIPFFGYKFNISIDQKFRLIRQWKTIDGAASDNVRLRERLLDRNNTTSDVRADTTDRSKTNMAFIDKQAFVSKVHRKKPHFKSMSRHIQRSNAGKSVIRSRVEACLCRSEIPDWTVHPYSRGRTRHNEDRTGQYCLQHTPLSLPREDQREPITIQGITPPTPCRRKLRQNTMQISDLQQIAPWSVNSPKPFRKKTAT
ncbi:transposase (class II) [Gluconobacter morbifer G707]|uniref:Transposase (Class II) n=1 Tax=Gluconobacter morbifer G707 TaxID=1088869 RepID=G6XHL3_9PROT|nr:transposase (class II) [Gluconobacter morbifer G707]